jgi:ceramide glucosyltransferase
MEIDHRFLPGVVVGLALGRARPCFGSTIALRRETLDRVGGFAVLADKLADDYALGTAIRRAGLIVTIPPSLLRHTCSEHRLSELVAREIRWARTIASVDPWGFAGSVITHPLPLALLGPLFGGVNSLTLGLIPAALVCRALLQIEMTRTFGLARARLWLGPVRDILSFAIYVASFFPGRIEWRGARFEIMPDGDMKPERE